MAQLKNSEGIVSHLQRIFYFGDEMKESPRVNDFLAFLSGRINPFTQEPYRIGARSLYRYIAGEQHFPCDLLIPLVEWSADEKLMANFNIRPSRDVCERLVYKKERILQEIKDRKTKLDEIDAQINGATRNNGKKSKTLKE